jgi:hypothetical protein
MAAYIPVTAILLVLFLTPLERAGGEEKQLPTGSEAAARKVSDGFIADLIAGRISDAVGKLTDPVTQGTGEIETQQALARKTISDRLNACGRPLDNRVEDNGKPVVGEIVHAESLDTIQATGPTHPTLSFFYVCRTTREGKRRFHVEVEVDGNGKYHISAFGCSRRLTMQEHGSIVSQPLGTSRR